MRRRIAVALLGALGLAGAAEAQLTGHYVNGVEGIKAASVPPAGFYLLNYDLVYRSDSLKGAGGRSENAGFQVDVPAFILRPVWVTKWKLFGGDVGMDFAIPLVRTHLQVGAAGFDQSATGVGDIFLEPLVVAWHRPQYDLATAVAYYAATGDWNRRQPELPGKGFGSYMFTFGGTYYPDSQKLWSASLLARYEVHRHHKELDVRAGNDLHFEWGLGRKVGKLVEVGVSGYGQWQVTDDRGADVTWDRSVHDRVLAVGPEVSYFLKAPKLILALRHQIEFAAIERPEGAITTLKVVKVF